MNEKTTLKISGSGNVVSGEYADIKISGSAKIDGDIICDNLKISGSCKSLGKIQASSIISSGSFNAKKEISVNEIIVSGSCSCDADVKAQTMKIDGSFKTDAHYVNAEYLEVNGLLKNDLEINVGKLNVNGIIKVKEIVGTEINIWKKYGFLMFQPIRFSINKVDFITCDILYAKNLHCKRISAEDITLKNNCKVEVVECNGILRIARNCSVNKIEGTCEIIHE